MNINRAFTKTSRKLLMQEKRSRELVVGSYRKRKPSPRKLEPHEVVAMLKARKVRP